MPDVVECENCGAVLSAEDVFCGECGAPRPELPQSDKAGPRPQPAAGTAARVPSAIPPAPPAAQPPMATNRGWRAAFIALVVLGAIACVLGLASFLLVGSIPGENMTPQENWLYSALCCLLPIGGTGALLAAAGGIVWYVRLREP
jgi:hypothetical protein